MAQYRIPHPYDPRFALPANVMAEPPGRHTITTAQRPRKSFEPPGYIPSAWDAHFALPKYIRDENIGRGSVHSHWARRRTVPTLLPDALGGIDDTVRPGFPGDPFKQYGERVSELLMGTIKQVPADFRQVALEAVLDELEPGLFERVTKRANEYKAKDGDPRAALQMAIASSVSEGLAKEVIEVGRTGKLPPMRSLMGLGLYDESYEQALVGLGFSVSGSLKKVGRAVKRTTTRATGTVTRGITKGATKAFTWGKKALNKIKDLTCTVMNNPLSDVAAGAAAASQGVPPEVGTAGKQMAQGMLCPPGMEPMPQDALTTAGGLTGMPKWVLPVGIGAAGLVAVLLLRK